MTTHAIKCRPEFFEGLVDGTKTAEVRRNDRFYRVGDRLILHEFYAYRRGMTGRIQERIISRVDDLHSAGIDGFVLLSFAHS